MNADFTFYIADIIESISLVLIIVGGIFAYYQWRKSVNLKRADYINELTEKIRTDESIKETIYIFDYDIPWYSKDFHGSMETELKVDKTLSYFSYICYLKKQKIISKKEFKFFEYEIKRTLINNQVQDYLYNLYHFANKFNVPLTFEFLFEYGKKTKCFDTDFYDANTCEMTCKYHKYLNF